MNANFILLPLTKHSPHCAFSKSDNNSLATQVQPCQPFEYMFPPVTLLGKEDQHYILCINPLLGDYENLPISYTTSYLFLMAVCQGRDFRE